MATPKKVEFFIPAPSCACSGASFLRDQEKLSRMLALMEEVEERFPGVELARYDMADESAYSDNLKTLARYLREAGEEDFASRIAFSLKFMLPAVAVGGKLLAYGKVPEVEEVVAAIGAV
ncbi:MAG: hypothetical protein HPY75_01905 [Actinobacteria bacterium]|nr:hypothetical protein [Actinomycetota bacterium]